MSDDLFLLDDDDDEKPEPESLHKWKLLVVDDEPEVHNITKVTLSMFRFDNKPLEFIHAYSGKEAKEILKQHDDIAMILLDVVMETDDAGLRLVEFIRGELDNQLVRIILRTGQPGQAPEDEVVENYDINDYKDKTELTSQKLRTLLRSSLRSYRDICSLERHRRGLEKVVHASRGIFEKHALQAFAEGALEQLAAILNLEDSCIYTLEKCAFQVSSTQLQLLAYQGSAPPQKKSLLMEDLPSEQRRLLSQAIEQKQNVFEDSALAIYCQNSAHSLLFYIVRPHPISESDRHFLNLLSENIIVALENIRLNDVLKNSQKETLYRIGEIVETRSKESGKHVKRVALYTALLAELSGLCSQDVDQLKLASPLHDVGKVATPDAILHKPGKLDAAEWDIMKSHAIVGEKMLAVSSLPSLQLAAEIAGSHHERWDGSGYPRELAGEAIPFSGRLTALADVFDALGSSRCYKKAWPDKQVVEHIQSQRAKHFDPKLVDILMANIDRFYEIRNNYKD